MTIEGEKVPAFSAITLNLPPQQHDETAAIIERSRAEYAVGRDFVERYVDEHYLLKNPSKTESKPASAPSPTVVSTNLGKATLLPDMPTSQPTEVSSEEAPTKRKRKRTRRKKSGEPKEELREVKDDNTLHLR
jgi:hypothetical protein